MYCIAIAEGGIDEWNFALHRYKTENLAAEKSRLQSALACSKQTWILSKQVLFYSLTMGAKHYHFLLYIYLIDEFFIDIRCSNVSFQEKKNLDF